MKTTMYLTQEQLIKLAHQQLKAQYPSLDITIVVGENTSQEDATGGWIKNTGKKPDLEYVDVKLLYSGETLTHVSPEDFRWSLLGVPSAIEFYRESI